MLSLRFHRTLTSYNTKQNLPGERTLSECSKLAPKEYKTRHDWVGKVIHGELSKKQKFYNSTKRYMHEPKSVQENETHKILWGFETQKYYLIPTKNQT